MLLCFSLFVGCQAAGITNTVGAHDALPLKTKIQRGAVCADVTGAAYDSAGKVEVVVTTVHTTDVTERAASTAATAHPNHDSQTRQSKLRDITSFRFC